MRRYALLLLPLLLFGCKSVPVKNFAAAQETKKISAEENRLWVQSKDFDSQIRKSDILYRNKALNSYLNSVMHRVYPELADVIRVKVIRAPSLNAFALPNGSIYLHIGMLARMDNEAQLATLLGHEAVHFIHKHGVKQSRNVKSSAAWAMGIGMATGIPLLGNVVAASSITGFSRGLERDADRYGYEQIVRAGYDARESVKIFEKLMAEVKALDIDEPYFFSTHPRLKERVASFKKLIAKADQSFGKTGEERFLKETAEIRIASLKEDIARRRYRSVLLVLEDESKLAKYPAAAHFYLGEAYRMRGGKKDAELAEAAYRQAVKLEPSFAPSYRVLGLSCMKRKMGKEAARNFRNYLKLAPEAADKPYILGYIKQIESEGGA